MEETVKVTIVKMPSLTREVTLYSNFTVANALDKAEVTSDGFAIKDLSGATLELGSTVVDGAKIVLSKAIESAC
jgi:hypothetical protein